MLKKWPFFIVWVCGINCILVAQEVHLLDLPLCLNLAAERSYQMRTLREDLLQSEYQLSAATNSFKTQVNMNLDAPDYTETIEQFEDSLGVYYTPTRQAVYSGNLVISQPLPTDGRFYLQSGVYGLGDFNIERNTVQLNTRLGFEQPLEAFYSYNRIQSGFKDAKLRYTLAQKRYARAELDLKYEVSSEFYNLVSAMESEKIALQTLQGQTETTELAQNKFRAGVIAEVEALQMEVDLAAAINNYDIARANRISQANLLKQTLDIPLTDSLVIASDLSYTIVEVDMDLALTYGMKNRLEISEREIQKELSQLEIDRVRVNGHVRGTLSAFYDFIGVADDPRSVAIRSTFGSAWEQLKRRPGNRGISLSISIPLWDWGVNKANVLAARASLREAEYALDNEKVTVEREIRDTVARLRSSLKRLQLLEKNVEIAEKSFEISRKRFENGDINSQGLALDRTRLSDAYLSRLEAFRSYKLLISDLTRKTFYDFELNRALVE